MQKEFSNRQNSLYSTVPTKDVESFEMHGPPSKSPQVADPKSEHPFSENGEYRNKYRGRNKSPRRLVKKQPV